MYAVLTPAYGNDYKNQGEVKAAWEAGKDFVINSIRGTTYINKADAVNANYSSVQIRYSKNTKVMVLKVS